MTKQNSPLHLPLREEKAQTALYAATEKSRVPGSKHIFTARCAQTIQPCVQENVSKYIILWWNSKVISLVCDKMCWDFSNCIHNIPKKKMKV
jgi:hypothetical protein